MLYYKYVKNKNESEDKMMSKKQRDIGQLATKIIAIILALLMVAGVAATLIYYLVVR